MTFLIVEDDKFVAEIIADNLKPLAKKVVIAYDMAKAMEIIKNASPVDLITLDLNLTDSKSHDTMSRILEIKKHKPNAIVIVITGIVDVTMAKRVVEYGADGLIEKGPEIVDRVKFFKTLYDVCASLIRQPTRYQKNITLIETISKKIADYLRTKPDAEEAPEHA